MAGFGTWSCHLCIHMKTCSIGNAMTIQTRTDQRFVRADGFDKIWSAYGQRKI